MKTEGSHVHGRGNVIFFKIIACLLLTHPIDGASTKGAAQFLKAEDDLKTDLASIASDSRVIEDYDTFSAITGIAPELSLLLDARAPLSRDAQEQPREPDDKDLEDLEKGAYRKEEEAVRESEKQAAETAKESAKAAKEKQVKAPIDPKVEEDAKTAAELTGVKMNKHGDVQTMMFTFGLNSGIVIAVFIVFSGLRRVLQMPYCANVYATGAPVSSRAGGWTQKIQYGEEISLEVKQFLGRDLQPEDIIRTKDGDELTFKSLSELEGDALKDKYPIHIKHPRGAKKQELPPLEDPGKNHCFGWIWPCFNHDIDDAWHRGGLDAAMTLQFCDMGMDILLKIGIPMVCIMCPLHYFFGGDNADDQLSQIAMGNVINKHPWMYFIHAIVVNLVTYVVISRVFKAMNILLEKRYEWLKHLPAPRCRTVLVEDIPKEWQSDELLLQFFRKVFPGLTLEGHEKVHSAKMVKDAPMLQQKYEELDGDSGYKACLRSDLQTMDVEQLRAKAEEAGATKAEIEKAETRTDKNGHLIELIIDTICRNAVLKNEEIPPSGWQDTCAGCRKIENRVEFYEKEITRLEPEVVKLREDARESAKTPGPPTNMAAGFVTFTDRREAEICHTLTISGRLTEWRISVPPPAVDVRYSDLKMTRRGKKIYEWIGTFLVCILYIVYIPLTVLGGNLEHVVHMGYFQPIWQAFAPGLVLMLFLAFLPTVFLLIFRSFFCLLSDTFAQHKLQVWYTYFLIFFVILVTVIGRSLLQTIANVAREPKLIFELMAMQMPKATHFYMDFLMIQWWDEAKALMRPFVTFKYCLFRFCFRYSREESRDLSEPEDQDFDGIGSRTSHLMICLLVGIIFSTLSPLIAILGAVFFAIARVVYGYLIIYAETKKPDLGGVFFHTQLTIVLVGVGIYNCLMLGVLMFRARTKFPMLIALPALIYTYFEYQKFNKVFVWKSLPIQEVCLEKGGPLPNEDNGLRYFQNEFFLPDGSDILAEKAFMRAKSKVID
jgi:hypothetical protein